MSEQPGASKNAGGGKKSDTTTLKPRSSFWIRLIRYQKRLAHKRKADREKQKAEESPADRAARKTAIATVWIAVLTLAMVGFSALTWYEIHTGGADTKAIATAAKDSAGAAQDFSDSAYWMEEHMGDTADSIQDSVDTADRNTKQTISNAEATFRDEQRAWVGVQGTSDIKGFTQTEPWRITVVFFNSGRTPARDVQSSGMYVTSPTPITEPAPQQLAMLTFRPAQSIAPQGFFRETIASIPGAEIATANEISGQQVLISQYTQIKNKQLFLYYFGILKYDDTFGIPHQTQYCVFLANPDTKEAGMCDAFNDLN